MKNKSLYSFLLIFILLGLYVPVSYSQVPTYTCTLANDVQTAANVYEFDFYILRTGTNVFELSGFQIGLTYNAAALNGGTLTTIWVSGTTDQVIITAQGQPK